MDRYDVDKGLETELAGVLQKQAGGEATRLVTSAPQSPSPVMQDGECGDGFYVLRAKGWPDNWQGFTSSCAQVWSQEELSG